MHSGVMRIHLQYEIHTSPVLSIFDKLPYISFLREVVTNGVVTLLIFLILQKVIMLVFSDNSTFLADLF